MHTVNQRHPTLEVIYSLPAGFTPRCRIKRGVTLQWKRGRMRTWRNFFLRQPALFDDATENVDRGRTFWYFRRDGYTFRLAHPTSSVRWLPGFKEAIYRTPADETPSERRDRMARFASSEESSLSDAQRRVIESNTEQDAEAELAVRKRQERRLGVEWLWCPRCERDWESNENADDTGHVCIECGDLLGKRPVFVPASPGEPSCLPGAGASRVRVENVPLPEKAFVPNEGRQKEKLSQPEGRTP